MDFSKDKKILAVCEKADTAICVLYNVQKLLDQVREEVKNKKVLYPMCNKVVEKKRILVSNEIAGTSFVDADFG